MSKITNDSLTRSGTGCSIAVPPYGNSGHQRVNLLNNNETLSLDCSVSSFADSSIQLLG